MNAVITIVIPVRNRAAIVGPTLESVAAQTLRPLAVVLVDNGSTDATLDVLRRWKEQNEATDFSIEIVTESIPGPGAARNAGLAQVGTEWTMFFDSDDLMPPGHAARALAIAKAQPDADIVGWAMDDLDSKGRVFRTRNFPNADFLYYSVLRVFMGTPQYMTRTALFRRAGGWDNSLVMAEDAELGMRLLKIARGVASDNSAPRVQACFTPGSLSRAAGHKLRRYLPAMEKICLLMPPEKRHWADLQIILMARTWAREDPDSDHVVAEIISRTPRRRRWLWRFFDLYSRLGGRGAWRLYFPFRNLI